MSVANASQHLQRLKRAGLVVGERRGTTICYRLADPAVARLWTELRSLAMSQLAEVDRALGQYRPERQRFPTITPEALQAGLARGDTVLLDVRPPEEFGAAHLLHASLQRLLALPPETLVLPGHTSAPAAFDHTPIAATLVEVQRATPLLIADEPTFVAAILGRLPPTPPNHAQIIALNEQGAALPADPTALEAGANRCAIA